MTDYLVTFGIKDAIDILCVALLLFYLYRMMKRTGSLNMFIGILVFIFLWMLVSQVFKMQLLGAIMDKLVDVGAIAIIVLFADDIRRFFRDLGNSTRGSRLLSWLAHRHRQPGNPVKWQPLELACENMGRQKVGALIVLGNPDELHDIILTGESVDAKISQRLIENIFFKNSPLHDGAMIICNGRVDAAACILPVSDRDDLPKQFGLRHRAAMGVTERCNAVAVVVSEETGHITGFSKDKFYPIKDNTALEAFLTENVR